MRTPYDLDSVPDDRLLADLNALVATDCRTQAKLLAHIGEVEQRRLYCALGYSSMHGYCTGELHLSEAAAYKRITAARAARRVPATLQPLAPSRFKVQLTIDDRTHDRLRRVRALLRHQVPDGDLATIFDRALDALEQQLMKRKFAVTERPRGAADESAPPAGSRHIPAAVKRAVLERVGLQCAWTSADGRRCDERGGLEFHHIVPYGKGGPPTVDNVTLLCRAHNQYQGVLDYGARAMRPRAPRAREPSAAYAHWSSRASGGRPATG